MVGASEDTDGEGGLVPAPKAGDNELFLRGDGQWADPTAALSSTVATLVGTNPNKSVEDIAKQVVAEAFEGIQDENLDELKEVVAWVVDHKEAQELLDAGNRLNTIESILNDKKSEDNSTAVEGLVSVVNRLDKQLNEADTGLVSVINNMGLEINNLDGRLTGAQTIITNLQTDVTAIKDALRWEIIEDVTTE